MPNEEIEKCQETKCSGEYEFQRYCGAKVCDLCDDHKGLARCFCGWSKSGNNGLRELEEMGEAVDSEPAYIEDDNYNDGMY